MKQQNKIYILAGIFLLVILFQFVYAPSMKNIHLRKKLYQRKTADYQKLLSLIIEYKNGEKKNSIFQIAPAGFSLFDFVSTTIEKNFSKAQIEKITPAEKTKRKTYIEEKMDITIKDIPIEKVVSFINLIEKQHYIFLSKFQITKNNLKPYLLTMDIQFVIYRKL
jgi:hypothetical protein